MDEPAAGAPAHPLLVWDFDGTLADTFVSIRAAALAALAAHELPPCDDDRLRATIGLSLAEALATVAAEDGRPPPPDLVASLVASYREAFQAIGTDGCLAFPGMRDLLAALGARGVVSTVATSRSRPSVERLARHLGLAAHLAGVHSTVDLPPGRGKPHPDVVLAACAALGRAPADCVVIGDAPVDIAMGRAAGVAATVAVTWGNGDRAAVAAAEPSHVVDRVEQLRAVLAPLTGG